MFHDIVAQRGRNVGVEVAQTLPAVGRDRISGLGLALRYVGQKTGRHERGETVLAIDVRQPLVGRRHIDHDIFLHGHFELVEDEQQDQLADHIPVHGRQS